jgi:HK97 family phage major capsid protein
MAKSSLELKQERGVLLEQANAILDMVDEDDRSEMTVEEKTKYDTLLSRAESLATQIDARERFEAAQRTAIAAKKRDDDEGGVPASQSAARVSEPRVETPRSYGKLLAFAKTREGERDAYRSGMWIRAALYGDMAAAKWCAENGVGVRAALSGGVNTAGGVLVPEEFERAIIDLREEYGLFRRLARVVPMGSDSTNMPRRVGGVTAYFVGENAEGTESDASWDNVLLSAKKLMVLTRMSSEIAEDAIVNLADLLAREIAYSFASKEDACGLIGTGTSTYGGIVGAFVKAIDGSHALATVAAAAGHDTFGELDLDDLTSLMALIPEYAKPGSAWICSTEAKTAVFDSLRAAVGGATGAELTAGYVPQFLGYPIYVSPHLPAGLATDYTALAMLGFGNLGLAATMGSRRGIRVGLSDQRYWSSDQIGVKGTERFDIVVHDLGSATVKSPFAVLTGGSG